MILNNFTKPELLTKAKARQIVSGMPAKVVAHHSFHVFFVGSITDRVEITVKHKDKCRVAWGEIINILDKQQLVEVKSQQLFPQQKEIKMKVEWDKELVPKLKRGDLISLHWGRIAERLAQREYNNLINYTMINYDALKELYGQ